MLLGNERNVALPSTSQILRPIAQIPKTQAGGGSNHAISAMKYEIIEEFLLLGWNVLLRYVECEIIANSFDSAYGTRYMTSDHHLDSFCVLV